MTNSEITAAATRLGIRPTRAPVGSDVWECWADRVREAQMHHTTPIQRNGSIDRDLMQAALDGRERAKREANRYAV